MSDDILNYANKESLALKEIRKYIKANKEEIVDEAIEYILINNDYKVELNKKNKKFRKSIIKGHFKWIIEDTKNPGKVDFSIKFKQGMVPSLYEAYCDFYNYLLSCIDELEISKVTMYKNALNDYYIFLRDETCKN